MPETDLGWRCHPHRAPGPCFHSFGDFSDSLPSQDSGPDVSRRKRSGTQVSMSWSRHTIADMVIFGAHCVDRILKCQNKTPRALHILGWSSMHTPTHEGLHLQRFHVHLYLQKPVLPIPLCGFAPFSSRNWRQAQELALAI